MERRGSRLSRRQFALVAGVGAAGLGLVAGCGRLPGQPVASAQPARVGLLADHSSADAEYQTYLAAFAEELRDRGYVEGQNIALELRFSEGHAERLPALARELVSLPVQVLVASGSAETQVAKAATSSIPIVIGNSGDPVAQGFVASLARPGGNVSGISSLSRQLVSKRLELLKNTKPSISRVAVIWNPMNPAKPIEFADMQTAAELLGIALQSLEVRAADEFDGVFEAITREGADAIVPLGDSLMTAQTNRVVAFAARSQLPTIYERQAAARAGGLMSYGPNDPARWKRVAYYVDRLLKGAKPADLPVEQPMTFDFVVNMKTAQALGITFPNEIMLQVTEVIQ